MKSLSLLACRTVLVLTICLLGIFHDFCRLLNFSKLTYSKYSFRNNIKVSDGLDPDQARRSVESDLSPSCLQRLAADYKIRFWQAKR